jgi:predicted permease
MTRRLSKEQRGVVAEKIMDWGNLVFTGLVIAQFVPGTDSFQWLLFLVGLLGIVVAYISGILLMKTKGGD